MADNQRYTVPHRRKREGRTNYKKRLTLLLSRRPRLIVRKSLRNVLIQIIQYQASGDSIVAQADSRQLIKLGWKHSRSNLPAAYLTGILAGKMAKQHKITQAIVDLGQQESIIGGRIYAAIKGVLDSGIDVAVSQEMLPKEDRLIGKHIDTYKKVTLSKDTLALKEQILKTETSHAKK